MSILRIGVIGCGGIGAVHLRSWAQVADAQVVAVCDADPQRANQAAAAIQGAHAHTDFHEMLANEQLDAVDICTPPHLHTPAALAAIGHGLAVLSEKPLARNPEEARQIVEAAEAKGTMLMTAFCHRFHPPVEAVKALLDEGKLGRVVMFRNRFGAHFKGVETRWFSDRELAGGGSLMDTSVHSIDLFRYLVGEVTAVTGAFATFNSTLQITPGAVEDSAAILLRAEGGAIGVIESSWQTPFSANVVEIYGETGAAVIDYDKDEARYQLEGGSGWVAIPREARDRFAEEVRHFAAVIRGEATPRMTGRDGLRAVEIIYDAYAASLP
jgi:predicted dehydrogenase